jgi:hypothetical protein
MSEPKPIYDDGTCRSSTNAPDYVAKWNPSINGEPLSKKQLHEVITSQSMTIDRLLGEVARRDDEIKERKIMMANYADMCEGYRKMNDEYHKMIEYYQHPHITKEYQVKLI